MRTKSVPAARPENPDFGLDRQALAWARAARVLVGFDGFVDQIVTPVARRHGPGDAYTPFNSLGEFAARIADAGGGGNANIELVPRLKKLGGNGPILAQALLSLGAEVRFIGALGVPEVHPLFADFARATRAVSLADPGQTTALEFPDGKLMFGLAQSLDHITYAALVAALGEEELTRTFSWANTVACVDWTTVPGLTGILKSVLAQVLPRLPPGDRLFFFDLADPAKRDGSELQEVLGLISGFARFGRVNLGLNRNEARQAAAAMGEGLPADAPLEAFAVLLRARLEIETVVIHTRDQAACAAHDGTSCSRAVPLCAQPRVSTGAGDHFNAGYLFGRNAGLPPSEALDVGTLVATAYVADGISPTVGGHPQMASPDVRA